MNNININPNPIYTPFFTENKRYNIAMGGRGNGRSYNIGGLHPITEMLNNKGLRIGLFRYIQESVRKSLWNNLLDRISQLGLESFIEYRNHQNMRMTFNGNEIFCQGFKSHLVMKLQK